MWVTGFMVVCYGSSPLFCTLVFEASGRCFYEEKDGSAAVGSILVAAWLFVDQGRHRPHAGGRRRSVRGPAGRRYG